MKYLTTISTDEKNKMLILYERKSSLEELLMSLHSKNTHNDSILKQISLDITSITNELDHSWLKLIELYNLNFSENNSLKLDFNTNKIYLY